jgi:hypothetical protein
MQYKIFEYFAFAVQSFEKKQVIINNNNNNLGIESDDYY